MASYYMIVFDKGFLESLKDCDANLGGVLWYAQQDNEIPKFPSLTNAFGEKVKRIPQNPTPVPAVLADVVIAKFVGQYYDGDAVGIDTIPAKIPPQSVVCMISTNDIYKLPELSNAAILNDIREFIDGGRDYFPQQGTVQPIFVNDTDRPFDLHVVKNGPFLRTDAQYIEYQAGRAFMMPKEHQCRHAASLIIG